jgi:hypothetical protein
MTKDDTVITYENILSLRPYSNPFLSDYIPPVEALAPQGDHFVSGILCSLGPITFFTASTGMENAPNLMVDLEKCLVNDTGTAPPSTDLPSAPTALPTAAPTTSGAPMHKYAIITVALALLVSQVQTLV